jgi:dolichyl-phosphate-mannose-protein mannosyltransferase
MRGLVQQWVNSPRFGWVSTLLLTALAAALRFIDLANPPALMFDETYYVKDAWTLGQTGAERQWPAGSDPAFEAGDSSGYTETPAFVVHPPLGKWIIWLGLALFGADSSFGWRFGVALVGTLTVPLLIATARLLLRSRFWAAFAGLLLAIEGQHIVLSRIAILDAMLTFFVLLGFYFVLRDGASWRIQLRGRPELPLSLRPWLLAAGLALGAATAIKWSGLWALAGFGIYAVLSQWRARPNRLKTVFGQGSLSFISLVPAAAASYLVSWTGWITGSDGWSRSASGNWLTELVEYHRQAFSFHTGLDTEHPYESGPLAWLISFRPVAIWFERLELGEGGCLFAGGCTSVITALPHPLIWLSGTFFMIWAIWRAGRDGTARAIAVGFAVGWLPWLFFPERTTFQFYAVVYTPFLVLAISYALQRWRRRGLLINRLRERDQALVVATILALALLLFFLSLWLGLAVPLDFWRLQLMMPNWI